MPGGAGLVQVLLPPSRRWPGWLSQHVACQHPLVVVACSASPASGMVASDGDPGAGCETLLVVVDPNMSQRRM